MWIVYTEHSLLKLLPGGPEAIRTPTMWDGVPNLTPLEQQRLQDSATMLDRCVTSISVTYSAGGHGHLEQASGAMSWSESCTQDWICLAGCSLILIGSLCSQLEYYEDMVICIFISSSIGYCSNCGGIRMVFGRLPVCQMNGKVRRH